MFDAEVDRQGRRRFVKIALGAGAVAAAAGGGGVALAKAKAATDAKLAVLPWPKIALAPDQVAARALEAMRRGGCGFAVFDALAGSAAEKLGDPYTRFPFAMLRFGAGGIQGWGTACGCLTGAAAAFELLSPAPAPLTDALFAWYASEPLPNLSLPSAAFPLVSTVAGSPLCRDSVARWSAAAGQPLDAPARLERCTMLAASVARRAAELLAAQAAGKPLPGAGAGGPHRTCAELRRA